MLIYIKISFHTSVKIYVMPDDQLKKVLPKKHVYSIEKLDINFTYLYRILFNNVFILDTRHIV